MHRVTGEVGQAELLAGVEQAADSIVITDIRGRIQYVNPAFTKLTGYSREEVADQPASILKSGQQTPEFYQNLWTTIGAGEIWQGEIVNRRKDGTLYREEMQISPVRDRDGKIASYIAIKRDVTTRRAADEAQGLLAAIVESSDAAIVAYTPAGIILTWNRGAEAILGYTAAEAVGRHLSKLLPPERIVLLTPFTERIMQGNAIPEYEGVCVRRDGGRINVAVTGSPIRNGTGAIVAISLIIKDISERRRTEEALRDSEERFRIMADGCPTVMWVTGADGENQFINRAHRELIGKMPEETAGAGWHMLLHPGDAPGYLESFQRAVRDHAPFSAETRIRRADGEWRRFASYAEPRMSAEGKFLGHVGLSVDITERSANEDALRFQYLLNRAIQEVSPDGILVLNEKNDIVSHNKKFLDVWRMPARFLPGNMPDYPASEYTRQMMSAALDRVKNPDFFIRRIRELCDDPDANDHCEIELRDGRTLERDSAGLKGEGGKHQGRVWFFRDVTERKEVTRSLQASEEKFRELAENIGEVFWMMDSAAHEILYISPAYEQIWEQKCESLYADPENWIQSIHPEDRAGALNVFGRQVRGELLANEYRIVRPSGGVRWIRDRAFPVRDKEGKIVRLTGIAEDITERKLSDLRLIHQGLHDDLTDLPNRRFFRQKLEHALREGDTGLSDKRKTGAVFFIDLDQFKFVNDTLGHSAGDDLLKAVTRRWLALEGVPSVLARFGGDEFTMFAMGLDGPTDARELGKKLLGCFDQPFEIAGQEVFAGVSIGVSLFPENGTDAEVLMKAADIALDEAKRNGKGQLVFFATELASAASGRLEMETRLRRAIAQSEFRLQYQPQFASGGLHPVRFEALIRWYPPDGPPVSPMEFIPIAEKNGLIAPIGTWVLEEACRKCAEWQTGDLKGIGVAVNVSAAQFAYTDFFLTVTRALESSGLAPALLELELTESVFLTDMKAPVRALTKLRVLGVTIALDDFGTGYSSLSYLQNLPLDALKIDRSFLTEAEGRQRGVALLRCVVELAHVHGLRVIAEGVETLAQRDLLESLGCDELQGYLLGVPSFQLAGVAEDESTRTRRRAGYPWSAIAGTVPVTFPGGGELSSSLVLAAD